MRRWLVAAVLALLPAVASAQTRLSSDFEIARMRELIERSPDFLSQLSARMNLGDLYRSRNDLAAADREYARALSLALAERVKSRRESDLSAYSTITAYAALAQAKLRRGAEAFALLEEAARYASDSPKTWNLYATAMSIVGRKARAVAGARNAVAIAAEEARREPSLAAQLDLSIYEYTLAAALSEGEASGEAEAILRQVVARLESPQFDSLRRQIERSESFEIYSTARGDADAWLSLANRAGLRLAALLEKRGDTAAARAAYERVLQRRTDDPTALAALARLSAPADRARWFAAAFDANPFSLPLVRSYQQFLAAGAEPPEESATTGSRVRTLVGQIHRRQWRAAAELLRALETEFPGNATLAVIRREFEAPARVPSFLDAPAPTVVEASSEDLRRILALFATDRLTPDQRAALDAVKLAGIATFPDADQSTPGQTRFESGAIGDVRFRFAGPTAFLGSFPASTPLRLTYRILGATVIDGREGLLLEPLGIEVLR